LYLNDIELNIIKERSGWKAKIGVIYIASSLSLEREWHMALPEDVSFHTARISIDGDSAGKEDIWNMVNSCRVEELSRQLASCEVDVIVFACTAGSFLGGPGWDEKLAKRISDAAGGIPATTTSTGLLQALTLAGCKKINMATPYEDNINAEEKAFVEAMGVEVANLIGEQCALDTDIVKVSPERYACSIMEMYEKTPDIDGVFISCTNSRTIELIDVMEKKLGIPVFSSNQVSLFSALKLIGYKGHVKGYGSLFDML
jgi:maleate isomerase